MFDSTFKKKGILLSIIPIYFIASLFVPMMNSFTYFMKDTTSFIATSQLIIHKFKKNNDSFGKGLKKFFIDGLETNALIEFFWYAMIIMFITVLMFIVGVAIFWLSKKNRRTGFNVLNTTGILYTGAVLTQIVTVLIATFTVPENVKFALTFNIPFVLMTVMLCALFIVTAQSMKKNFKEPKLRQK